MVTKNLGLVNINYGNKLHNPLTARVTVGGPDREVSVYFSLPKLGYLNMAVAKVTKNSDETEWGFCFVVDTLFIDWFRKGGLDSSPTFTLRVLDLLFGEESRTERLVSKCHTNIVSQDITYPVVVALNEYKMRRPRIPWVTETYRSAELDFGIHGIIFPDRVEPNYRVYMSSYPCDSITEAIKTFSKDLDSAWLKIKP